MNQGRKQNTEFSGKNIQDALAKASRAFGVPAEDLSYQIVEDTTRSILGLVISGLMTVEVRIPAQASLPPEEQRDKPAGRGAAPVTCADKGVKEPVTRARTPLVAKDDKTAGKDQDISHPKRNPPELEEVVCDMLSTLLDKMGILAAVEVVDRGGQVGEDRQEVSPLMLNIVGDDLGMLIGRRGEALRDLQFMVRLIVSRKIGVWPNVVLDVEGYKARRAETLRSLALRMAEQACRTERRVVLEPMPAHERRIVHIALRDVPDVHTESTGDGDHRKVQIFPN